MQAVNISLFQWLATLVAEGTSWLCLAVLAVATWRQPAQRGYAMATLAAAGVAALAAHALAQALNLPRPFVAGLSPNYIAHGARGSLPSAHASVMFTLALVLCLRPALRTLGLVVFAIALVTGWARIYVGVHFPFDIAAGLALAVVITALFWLLTIGVRRFVVPLIARDAARS